MTSIAIKTSKNKELPSGLLSAAGALLSPSGARGRLAVFCYHQVLEQKDPLRHGEPDRADFAADLGIIARVFNVLPLPEAVGRLADGTLPARAACITFDDGYANNHEFAAPMLEQVGLPATFFVAGGAVDTGVMWNDLIIEGVRIRNSNWIVEGLAELGDGITERDDAETLITQVLQRLKYVAMERRWILAESFYRTNTEQDLPRLMMNRDAVSDLARRDFDIGGHTLQHPILTQLSDQEADREIAGCRRWIEEVTGRTAKTFAYPNGIPGRDFGPEHVAMVRQAGFGSAVSTCWSVASPGCDRYDMPRIGPWWRLGGSLTSGFLRTYLKTWLRRSNPAL